jgi:hypothetical protein
MTGIGVMRGTLLTLPSALGGLEISYLYYSFVYAPVAAYAAVFLGTASTIAWFVDKPVKNS